MQQLGQTEKLARVQRSHPHAAPLSQFGLSVGLASATTSRPDTNSSDHLQFSKADGSISDTQDALWQWLMLHWAQKRWQTSSYHIATFSTGLFTTMLV